MKIKSILEGIGNTPHLKLNRLFPENYEVWVKLERNNPGGSIKDRIALAMVEDAEQRGLLRPGSVIVEPTSGNTGIGLALVAAVRGYRTILVMPESMSMERRSILRAYGAEIELTPREKGMKGAIERSRELAEGFEHSWQPFQFENPANPGVHEQTTAMEILEDFPEGFDYLVSGVGTGGHLSGVGRVLKKEWPDLKVYAVEPSDSPVISGGSPGPHGIQGIGAGFVPGNLDREIIDGTLPVEQTKAFEYARRCARQEGLFAGISSGASLAAVAGLLEKADAGSRILTFNYDSGERYLSVNDLF